ncbi:Futalosine hydrolase [Deinococcus malanensis]|uniref:Futalosine hydrolase n=1 Tax=Deinococcus malanensis TaxID=1706855 RepID=A0ABQ2ELE2_9DEIO|nr:Futalosine hydrolase [Deinococcus malanensis]
MPARVVVSGVGPVAAALATAKALAEQAAPLVVSAGIGGAFPASGLRPGDLAISSLIVQADLGAWDGENWLTLGGLGLSVHPTAVHHAEFEVWTEAADSACKLRAGFGPALTLSAVTGDHAGAARLEARYPGVQTEGMEGAGVAHAAMLAGVPVVEVRGISNLVGPRDRASWQIGTALDAAQRGVIGLLHHLN